MKVKEQDNNEEKNVKANNEEKKVKT